MRRHIFTSCCVKETFTVSGLSRAPFRLTTSSEELEHVTLAAIAPLLVKSG